MKNTPLLFCAMAAVTILSACGGGGSNDNTSFNGTAASPYRTLQTTVPAPSYTAGSRELAEFNTLNEQRAKCGFGLLANNEQLKFAAIDHVSYLAEYAQKMTDAGLSAHGQYPQYPNGFTGATPLDRAKYRGYTGRHAGETIAAGQRYRARYAFYSLHPTTQEACSMATTKSAFRWVNALCSTSVCATNPNALIAPF